MFKLRKVPLTDQRARAAGESYRYLYVLAQMMDIEYQEYKDTDFKDGITHKEIGVMNKAIQFILHKHAKVLGGTSDDNVLAIAHELGRTIKKAINVDSSKS